MKEDLNNKELTKSERDTVHGNNARPRKIPTQPKKVKPQLQPVAIPAGATGEEKRRSQKRNLCAKKI